MSAAAVSLVDQALRLVDKGSRDPLHAVRMGDELTRILTRVREHAERGPSHGHGGGGGGERGFDFPIAALGASHIIRVAEITPLGIAPGGTTGTLKVEWPGGKGVVRSIYAGTTDGQLVSLSSVSLRVTINGTDDLFTDGENPAFVPLVAFQSQNHNWFRIRDYEVTAQQRWTVELRNENTAGPNLIPFVLFGYARTSKG